METGLFGEPSHTCIDVRANEKYITRGTPNTHSCERLQKPERDLCPNQVNYTNECEEWSTIKSNPCIQSARRTHRDITYRTRMAMIHTFVSVELLPRNFFFILFRWFTFSVDRAAWDLLLFYSFHQNSHRNEYCDGVDVWRRRTPSKKTTKHKWLQPILCLIVCSSSFRVVYNFLFCSCARRTVRLGKKSVSVYLFGRETLEHGNRHYGIVRDDTDKILAFSVCICCCLRPHSFHTP